jgi:hypothetical protein
MVHNSELGDNSLASILERSKQEMSSFYNTNLYYVLRENNNEVDRWDNFGSSLKEVKLKVNGTFMLLNHHMAINLEFINHHMARNPYHLNRHTNNNEKG